MEFKFATCPHCHSLNKLMSNKNNPMAQELCFECLAKIIDVHNINDAEKFCRTYNIAFIPEVWIRMAEQILIPAKMIETYAAAMLDEKGNIIDPATNLYADKAGVTFDKMNTMWAEHTKQEDILSHIEEIKDSFMERAQINWGKQYSFEELVKLEDLYYQSLRANAITNPIQRESLRTLLKIMIDINKSITGKDSGELKNLTSAFSQLAKTAQLDNLIDETHTDDLTTLAEVVQVVEDSGYEMPYYDGSDKDGIDFAIKDIEDCNRKLVRDATGLGPQIEQMVNKYQQEQESKKTKQVEQETPIEDIISKYNDENMPKDESDDVITNATFDDDK